MTLKRDLALIDFKAFGIDVLILFSPGQGWQPWFTEPVGNGTAFWLGPLHGALCKTR